MSSIDGHTGNRKTTATATKGDRCVKDEQIVIIANMLQTDREGLLALWFAEQVFVSVANNMEVADKAMRIVKKNINNIEKI